MQRRSIRMLAVAMVGLIALTGCGKKGRGHSSGLGGFASGGSGGDSPASAPSGLPTDLPTGLPTDLPSGLPSGIPSYTPGNPTPASSYSAPPTYDPDATSDTDGSNCDYDESTGRLMYDVTATNPDTTQSFEYSISVKWNDSSGGLLGVDSQYVTVLPSSSRTVTLDTSYTLTQYTSFTCQITTTSKSPTG
ncbi:hypothetical protein [Streptomyces sp. NPDC005322]|uniref:hypothetical protein n=1 Tax=Streptomyces sp. NPDC005322 TaxID=3157032 RepID=UPI0033A4A867